MGQLVLDRPILLTTARHAFTSFRADLRSGTLHTAFDVHVAHPVYWPYGLPPSFFAFSRQLKKKKKTPISTLPFPDFPILFFFLPFFEGGKNLEIWKKFTYENLGICSSHCNRFNGWSIKWIVNFGIKVHYESIAEGSSRAISVFLCPFAWIFLVTLFIITWIYFRR